MVRPNTSRRRQLTIRLGRLARDVSTPLRARWHAWRTRDETPTLALDAVRRRLELLVAALYERPVVIEHDAGRKQPGRLARLLGVQPPPPPLAASDGERIRLPARLDAREGPEAALARYRLLALAQAERIARGTARHAPREAALLPHTRLERDLYLLAESAAVDAALGARVGGVARALDAERRRALAARPPLAQLPALERAVESLVRQALGDSSGGTGADDAPPRAATPEGSRAWARAVAARLRTLSHGYGGVPDVAHWGTVLTPRVAGPEPIVAEQGMTSQGAKSGAWGDVDAEPQEGNADGGSAPPRPGSEERPTDRPPDRTQAAGAGEQAETQEDGPPQDDDPLRVPDGAPLDPVDAASRVVPTRDVPGAPVLARYPEWDHEQQRDVQRAVTVRDRVAPEGDASWAAETLAAHASLVRRVRERFERLRARRLRLPRQRDGGELDLDAVTRALVDRRLGKAMDERLWVNVHPGRRGLAIALLVDVSGSTEARVSLERRIIDVEREAVLLASEAFDALGDRYAIMTFSGHGRNDVRIGTLKAFDERNSDTVRRRIAAVAADGNTRLGAAVRHATSLLTREGAGHRLLLILSDGRPNDTDRYFEQYAIQDSRRAVLDARAAGVHVFCLTVDKEEGEDYLPRIFTATGFTILRHAEGLPAALLGVVRQMLGARSGS